MVASSSSKVLGTSRLTTSSVSAKPKTASAKPSIRNTSWPRQENPSSPPIRLCANLLRSISIHRLPTFPKLVSLLGRVPCYPSGWSGCHRVSMKLLTFFARAGAARSLGPRLDYCPSPGNYRRLVESAIDQLLKMLRRLFVVVVLYQGLDPGLVLPVVATPVLSEDRRRASHHHRCDQEHRCP